MPVSTGDANTSDGEGSRAATGSISLTIIIPLVAIAVLALVGGLLVSLFSANLGLRLMRSGGVDFV